MSARHLTLTLLPGVYSIARLSPDGPEPGFKPGPVPGSAPFRVVVRTAQELSVIAPREEIPGAARAEHGYRVICLGGPFELSEVGVLASVLSPLAAVGVSVLTIATFDTDYVLIKDGAAPLAIDTLQRAGHSVTGV